MFQELKDKKNKNKHVEFCHAQRLFDKAVKRHKRKWNRTQMLDLENVNLKDPNEFWASIKKMGRKVKKDIPMEVYDSECNILTDINDVLTKWGAEFGSLFEGHEMSDEEMDFLNEISQKNRDKESTMHDDDNMLLNRPFTVTEVRKIILASKNKKAPGLDGLTNEILKNELCIGILTRLFNYCLETGLLPTPWLKAVIKPIPKNSKSDPRVPMNYRGISLMPTISKMYSALLGNRVRDLLETNQVLVNEQNGFRANRSCEDHIFTLCDLLRIRKQNKEETFCAFINFQKAFDSVNHEYLLHKLLNNGIVGKMYNVIKSIYTQPVSCVNINRHLTDWFPIRAGV